MDARRTAGLLALVGAGSWTLKLGLIAANGGENLDQGVVGAAYLVGVAALFAAGAATGVALTRGRPVWQRVLAGVVGLVVTVLLASALDSAGKAVVGDAGPAWLPDEVGIALMALVGWAAAALLLRRRRTQEPEPVPAV